jgi:hypothetical protein
MDDEVTQDFLKRVDALIRHNDEKVHASLSINELQEAALFNAGVDQLREVVDIPEQIKIELEENSGEENHVEA